MCRKCDRPFEDPVAVLNCPCLCEATMELPASPAEEGQTDEFGFEPLVWNFATTKFLVDTCQEKGIVGPAASKQQRQSQWMAVKDVFVAKGYDVKGFQELRKKWYRLVDKYKEVKQKMAMPRQKNVSWTFYEMLDDAMGADELEVIDETMGGDPCVAPVPSLSTTPLSSQPLRPVSVEVSMPDTSGGLPQCPAAGSPPLSGVPRRKRRRPNQDSDLMELLARELENRRQYRAKKLKQGEEKLRLLREIATACAASNASRGTSNGDI